jgi:hypothetical protein
MKRIFTLCFFAAFAIGPFQSFAQTSCSPVTSNGNTAPSGYVTSGAATNITSGSTVTYISPIYYFNSSQTTIDFFLRISADQSGGNTPTLTPMVNIRWGTGGSQSFTCAAGSAFSYAGANNEYFLFSITPATTLNANTNFEIRVTLTNNSGNRAASISQFGVESGAVLAPGGAVLPVRISAFDVKKAGSAAQLSWHADAEENVSRYEIERSSDGRSFSVIGTLAAVGQYNYSYADAAPLANSFYRIKAVDHDGRKSISAIVKFTGAKSSIVLNAFPMPAKNSFTLQHGSALAGSRISISTQDGRVVKNVVPSTGAQQTLVDITSLNAGMYLVRFEAANGEVETLKLVKQ